MIELFCTGTRNMIQEEMLIQQKPVFPIVASWNEDTDPNQNSPRAPVFYHFLSYSYCQSCRCTWVCAHHGGVMRKERKRKHGPLF